MVKQKSAMPGRGRTKNDLGKYPPRLEGSLKGGYINELLNICKYKKNFYRMQVGAC